MGGLDMAQRVHDLIEQTFAGFGFQVVGRLVLARMRLHVGQSRLHILFLPVERGNLQLHVALRVGFADALLKPCDALRVGIDDHEHGLAIVGRDSPRQLLYGSTQHLDGDFAHLHGSVFIAVRREQRQQEVGE